MDINSEVLNAYLVRSKKGEREYLIVQYDKSIGVFLGYGEDLLLSFPCDNEYGEESYSLHEVVNIVQWHIDNALYF